MPPIFVAALIASVAALLATPVAIAVAHRHGWTDDPGLRKVHERPVAYLGGAVVFVALLAAVATVYAGAESIPLAIPREVIAIVGGATLMFGLGLVDDIQGTRARTKLGIQLIAAAVVVSSGVSIEHLVITESLRIEFGIFAAAITVLWIVGVTNALNIIDGLDGLASGISIIAAAAIGWTTFQAGNDAAGFLMSALMGAVIGFLPYNVHPARVFLGDAGSLTIGFLLSSTAALTATKAPTLIGIGVPLVALGIPILDTLFSMGRRVMEGRSIMSADRNHLHHRLIELGYGHPRAVLLICTVTAVAVVTSMSLVRLGNVARVAIVLASFTLYMAVFRLTGAIRISESLRTFRRVARNVREMNDEKQAVDELALHLAEARRFDDWWDAVTATANALSIDRLVLAIKNRDQGVDRIEWQRPGCAKSRRAHSFELRVPDRRANSEPKLTATLGTGVPLDQVGRTIGRFCELLSAHNLATLPCDARVRPRMNSSISTGPSSMPIA